MTQQFADNFIVRLAEGVIGWLGFQQAANRASIYSEYLFYPPMFELGSGRGWRVTCQKALADRRRMTYDMLFTHLDKQTSVGVEAKFVKSNHAFTGKINNDLKKLELIKTDTENHQSGCDMFVYELVIGREDRIQKAIAKTPLEPSWADLWRPENGDGKLAKEHPGWLLYGPGQKSFRYSAAVFRYDPAWAELAGNVEQDEVVPDQNEENLGASIEEEIAEGD